MQLSPGMRLAHYEIVVAIGRGGMGEVFRAKDNRLGRDVAIKVIPDDFAKDAERLARFEREARLLAALNHPRVAAIYGLEEFEGTKFLVLELAEGEDLSLRIQRGAMPIDDAVSIASQIAEALEAAHEKGIIHRDLKPANVKVSASGEVKVLDFGLAKAADSSTENADLSNSPTMVRAATNAGMILGTAAYMAPEQARGKSVDRRADIWAFGVVLWEMLSGRKLFSGETVSDTLAAVLTKDVDLSMLPAGTPPGVRWVLERCLVRDPRLRLRDIGEARFWLSPNASTVTLGSFPVAISERPRRVRAGWIALAAVAGLAAGALIGLRLEKPPVAASLRKVDITLKAPPIQFATPVLSPDGKAMLIATPEQLTIRRFDETEERALANTAEAIFVCWSPDGREIAYVSRNRLWRVGTDGKPPVAIATLPRELSGAGGMAWLSDDRIVLAGSPKAGLLEVPARGGTPRMAVPLDEKTERDFHEVSPLPDGRGVLVVVHEKGGFPNRIDVQSGANRTKVVAFDGAWLENPVYSPTGHVLFGKAEPAKEIWAIPFSLDSLKATGDPFLVASGMSPSIANDGTLAWIRGERRTKRQLLRVDRHGLIERDLAPPAMECRYLDLSADGRRVVATVLDDGYDLMVFDIETRTTTRLTSGASVDWYGDWSRDGKSVLYEIGDRDSVAIVTTNPPGEPRVMTEGYAPRWWPDEASIVFERLGEDGSYDLWRRWLDGGREEKVLATPRDERYPVPSPDGTLVAYMSDETGRDEMFVREVGGSGLKFQVSSRGVAGAPRWSPASDELYYRSEGALVAVRRAPGTTPSFSAPEALFSFLDAGLTQRDVGFDVTPDGKGFVVTRDVPDEENRAVITLVTNWFEEFRK
ncbi:MAG: protein kinase domain-containing protein [Thermoanaerobaculia bacterium]